jgi:hypothetical protein
MVDQAGLTTWKVDTKAMVQAAGGNWRPLKDLLAMQEAAAKYAEQNNPSAPVPAPSKVLPLVPPPPRTPPKSARAKEPSAVLPLVPPPPRDTKLRKPTRRPASEPMAAVPVVDEPSPIPAIPEPLPEPALDAGPAISPADFEQQDLVPPSEAFAPEPTPALAAPEEPALPQAWADDAPAVFETAAEALAAPMPEPVIDAPVFEAPVIEAPAVEAPVFQETTVEHPIVEEPIVATEDEVSRFPPPEPEPSPEPVRNEAPWEPEPSQWRDAVEPQAIGSPRAVLTFADDPGSSPSHSDSHFAHGGSSSYTEPPARPDEGYTFSSAEPGFEEEQPDDDLYRQPRPFVLDERIVRFANGAGVVLSKSLDVLGRLFRDLWERLRKAQAAHAARRPVRPDPEPPREVPRAFAYEPETPPIDALADEPSAPRYGETYGESPSRPTPTEDLPVIPLKPIDAEGSLMARVQSSVRSLGAGVLEWTASLRSRVEELFRRDRPATASPAPWSESETFSSPSRPGSHSRSFSSVAYEAPPRETVQRPPTTNELPVIRLARVDDEPAEPEDLYDGPSESAYFPTGAVWLWTKRLAWTAVLASLGFLAYQNWEAWSPGARRIGSTALTGVTKLAESRDLKAREEQALVAATGQLPYLGPDTLRLVISQKKTGVPPDPPEIFQLALAAAERGQPTLTGAEQEELTALQKAVVDGLSPAERILLREYDGVRSRRTPFPFEDKSAMDLYARGARGLPAESRERLQALLGSAISAGLASPASGATVVPPKG